MSLKYTALEPFTFNRSNISWNFIMVPTKEPKLNICDNSISMLFAYRLYPDQDLRFQIGN